MKPNRLVVFPAAVLFAAVAACGDAPPPPVAAPAPPPPAPVVTAPAPPPPRAPVSGIDRSNFDPAVRPQDDLFRAVNGGWLAKTEIPADKSSYGAGAMIYDTTQVRLRAIIDAAASAPTSPPGSEAQKIGDLYNSFMDESKADALGKTPIDAELARIDALKSKDEIPDLLAHYNFIGVTTPIGMWVHQDNKDATRYVVDFAQSGLGLPDRDYYVNPDKKFVQLRAAYAAYAAKNLGLIGVKDAEGGGKTLLALETRIAQSHWNIVDTREADKVYNKLDRAKLKGITPGFDWDGYLKANGVGEASVIVSEPSYFTGFARIWRETSLDTWKLYFKNLVVSEYSPYLGKPFVEARFEFRGKTLYGTPENRPRWKRGVEVVEESVGEALGKLYVAKHFPPEHKARMQQLVGNMLKAYEQSIDSLDWMSADTKKTARAKLSTFAVKIGYPDSWRDYSTLEIKRDDLVGNVMRARTFETKRNLNKLGKPVDRGEWLMTPQTVDAMYNPEVNDITFTAGILQPPMFNMDADDAVNYGAIGTIIGHEISHGFDDQGSKYDGAGNLRDWWTKEDRARFVAKTKALATQYDAYEPVKGFHVNGALTLGENIADLGGLSSAIKAYHLSLGGRPAPELDGFTGDQRVLMGHAQSWAKKSRDEALINQMKSDPHSPGEFRVNGVVVNVPEFYSALGVKQGDRLWKPASERIKIW